MGVTPQMSGKTVLIAGATGGIGGTGGIGRAAAIGLASMGLRESTFALPLALIHPSAGNVPSRKPDKKVQELAHLGDTLLLPGEYAVVVTWEEAPREGVGSLPTLLLNHGSLPLSIPCLPLGERKETQVTDSDDPRTGGWRFFLWWMLAFLGFPLGGLLAFVLVGSVEGAVSGALGGALVGAVIGAAQWLVLRRYLRVGPEWILFTALGVAIGDGLGALLTGAGTGLGALLITGLATGVAVGLLQWGLALRNRLLLGSLWPLVVAIAWPVGWTVTWAAGIDVERGYYVFGASGALVFAALTGLAMLLMLRGRTR